ncbi:MAG: PEGA domain-containing protein [Fibrobacter sp.]|nr:PEGA domain-containing protein [Fibrobacter sp.]
MKKIFFLLLITLFANTWADDDFKVPPRGKTGYITVETDPANSDVYLAGDFLGKSPIKKKQVPSGRHNLIIIDQGYELVNERFNVWPDKDNVFEGKTVIPKGHIKITTNPPKCHIYVDGDQADFTDGAALEVRNLDAGDHVVKAVCGRRSKEALVNVKGEEVSEVHIDVMAR